MAAAADEGTDQPIEALRALFEELRQGFEDEELQWLQSEVRKWNARSKATLRDLVAELPESQAESILLSLGLAPLDEAASAHTEGAATLTTEQKLLEAETRVAELERLVEQLQSAAQATSQNQAWSTARITELEAKEPGRRGSLGNLQESLHPELQMREASRQFAQPAHLDPATNASPELEACVAALEAQLLKERLEAETRIDKLSRLLDESAMRRLEERAETSEKQVLELEQQLAWIIERTSDAASMPSMSPSVHRPEKAVPLESNAYDSRHAGMKGNCGETTHQAERWQVAADVHARCAELEDELKQVRESAEAAATVQLRTNAVAEEAVVAAAAEIAELRARLRKKQQGLQTDMCDLSAAGPSRAVDPKRQVPAGRPASAISMLRQGSTQKYPSAAVPRPKSALAPQRRAPALSAGFQNSPMLAMLTNDRYVQRPR